MNRVRDLLSTVYTFLFPPRLESESCRVKGYRLYTGANQHSYVETIEVPCLQRFPVAEIYFRQTPPGCVYDKHTAPQKNYVLTLCGTLLENARRQAVDSRLCDSCIGPVDLKTFKEIYVFICL
jgi:hypothetical protein